MTPTRKTTSTTIVLAAAALLLTGCTQLSDVALHHTSSHAETRADLESPPSWMPDDATDITSVTGNPDSTTGSPATTVFSSQHGVSDPTCTTRTRNSAPTTPVMGAPDVYPATTVLQCGAWSMTNDGDRWVAWTPNPGDRPTSVEQTAPAHTRSGS